MHRRSADIEAPIKDPQNTRDLKIHDDLSGVSKDHEERHILEINALREQGKFINRSYWLCIMLFIVSGLAMLISVFDGGYRDVILAESIIRTVLGTLYIVLFIVMVFWSSNETLKVAILLFVSCFIGVVGGFMVGVNLKLVIQHLEDSRP